MQWTDEGIVIGARPHGETSVVLELLTRAHGRHLGLVRGGRSKRLQPTLQVGNEVMATWSARLDSHLGLYVVEPTRSRLAGLMAERAGLAGVAWLAALARLLPERDPHEALFAGAQLVADALPDVAIAGALMVRFELQTLTELGFGLDLTECAATGSRDDLIYVSPKSGRAVSREAGAPYAERLFALPGFLLASRDAGAEDVRAGFRLTGYFLDRDVFGPRGLALPQARSDFIALI